MDTWKWHVKFIATQIILRLVRRDFKHVELKYHWRCGMWRHSLNVEVVTDDKAAVLLLAYNRSSEIPHASLAALPLTGVRAYYIMTRRTSRSYAQNQMAGVGLHVRRKIIISRRAVWRPLCITFIMICVSIWLIRFSGLPFTSIISDVHRVGIQQAIFLIILIHVQFTTALTA